MSVYEGGKEGRLSYWEAEERVQSAVDEMETALNRLNDTPNLKDVRRREYLMSHFMSFLEKTYEIVDNIDSTVTTTDTWAQGESNTGTATTTDTWAQGESNTGTATWDEGESNTEGASY